MSCYTVDKRNYISCAGFLAALNNRKNFAGFESGLWFGEFTENENGQMVWGLYEDDDFIKLFKTFYQANRLSVERRYNDPITTEDYKTATAELTPEERQIFEYGKRIGIKCIDYRACMQQSLMSLSCFVDCVNYQTEDNELCDYIMKYMNCFMAKLYRLAYSSAIRNAQDRTYERLRKRNKYMEDFDLTLCEDWTWGYTLEMEHHT